MNFDRVVLKELGVASIGICSSKRVGSFSGFYVLANFSLPHSVDEVETLAAVRELTFA